MKSYLLTFIFVLVATTVSAQQNKMQFSPEQFQKHMEAFIKGAAQLTDAEAQKFFPMLAEMQKQQRENSHQIRVEMQKGSKAKTEEEYANILREVTRLENLNTKLDETYNKKFKTVLSWKKIFKVRQALEQYNMMALQRFTPQPGTFRPGTVNPMQHNQGMKRPGPGPMWNGQRNHGMSYGIK